ncbi:MAG: fatty acid hydroxylase family protein [Alphaproteobacteria bacterium]|nr:fatty acid hydroxylase family protein [Alphaproteobacteria bacterium]
MDLRDLVVAYATYPAIQTYAALALFGAGLAVAWGTWERWWLIAAAAVIATVAYPAVWYALHRFVLHGRFLYKSPLTAALWKRIHFDHHQDPHRLEVLFGALVTTLPTIALVTGPIGWALEGRAGAASAIAAALLATCFYEFCHCVQHLNYKPRAAALARIKQLHLAHHFHCETGNYGITNFVCDRLLGTYYATVQDRPRSPTVFNLGYDEAEARRYPWVAALTGSPPMARPPRYDRFATGNDA